MHKMVAKIIIQGAGVEAFTPWPKVMADKTFSIACAAASTRWSLPLIPPMLSPTGASSGAWQGTVAAQPSSMLASPSRRQSQVTIAPLVCVRVWVWVRVERKVYQGLSLREKCNSRRSLCHPLTCVVKQAQIPFGVFVVTGCAYRGRGEPLVSLVVTITMGVGGQQLCTSHRRWHSHRRLELCSALYKT